MTPDRLLRRARRIAREALSENQWLLPAVGAAGGVLLAVMVGRIGRHPDPETWTITIDRARDTLMGWLSILFAALSIVLALASVTAQNVVGRYSSRMLRIYIRHGADRLVVGAFAMAGTYILVEQYQLRSFPPDDPAPVTGVLVSVGLLILVSVLVIWYISALIGWFRVDRSARRVSVVALRAAHTVERAHRGDLLFPGPAPDRPPNAVPVRAANAGYMADVDTGGLFDLAIANDIDIVIDRSTGTDVLRGEPIGWISAHREAGKYLPADQVAEMVDVSDFRELATNVGYSIVAMVDIAIMALSPAVNDPNSAVQVIEELGFLFSQLADVPLGPYGRADEHGRQRVLVVAPTLGDHIELATTQIVIYGAEDPAVVSALRRLVRVLESLELTEQDASVVAHLAAGIEAAAQTSLYSKPSVKDSREMV